MIAPNGEIAAVVLAGGTGRRMGSDKSLLRLPDGRSSLDAVLEAARAVTPTVFLAVDSAAHGWALLENLHELPCMLVDTHPGAGPLAALADAIEGTAGSRGVLLLAVDTPLVVPALLRLLCAGIGWARDSTSLHGEVCIGGRADIVAPVIAGLTQPMPALYSRALHQRITMLLAGGRRSLRALIEDPSVTAMLIDEPAVRGVDPLLLSFIGANTPSEWARLRTIAAGAAHGA
jgi:molybdopterin-guanine dinucleotide biosynthesis protein A